jgi:hypothetical protein
MKKVAVLQSNYIPWKGYFDLMAAVDEFILYDDVQFTKNDWRNRNKIMTPKGVDWLSIPVRQERLGQKISETRIVDARWPVKHWKAICQNYSKASCFRSFCEPLEALYKQAVGVDLLSDVNAQFLKAIAGMMGIKTRISSCSDYVLKGDRMERLVSLCSQAGADVYLSGPAARSYLEESMFTTKGMAVEWFDYSGYTEYDQLFPPFEHGVSVIDLLLNAGHSFGQYMKVVK